MKITLVQTAFLLGAAPALFSQIQSPSPAQPAQPILHVTVIARTTSAVNYEYRALPTNIDFKGTVLLPKAKGKAYVECKPGRTEIDMHIDGLSDPQKYGREYLTYVLWALTPDGRPHNLGQLISNSSDKAKLKVSTDLQAFAMIVTAEPYSAVRQPSDVVVAENEVRPDTIGRKEMVSAKYELLPRGHYAWTIPNGLERATSAPKVSMREYEALSELYQAQNAIGIARQAGAEQWAAGTLHKAQMHLADAERSYSAKDHKVTVENAREAAQTAEDARLVAEKKKEQQQLADARIATNQAELRRQQLEMEARQAQQSAIAAQQEAEAQRMARQRAESEAAAARQQAAQAEARATGAERERADAEARIAATRSRDNEASRKHEARTRLMNELNRIAPTRDTPRGLVVTFSNTAFSGSGLRGATSYDLAHMRSVLAQYPGLRIDVEGHMDTDSGTDVSWNRAEAVRLTLVRDGQPSGTIVAHGYGNARPVGPNSSPAEREKNRRVELVITGDSIGNMALWDSTYRIAPR